jgi:hypothetical protein
MFTDGIMDFSSGFSDRKIIVYYAELFLCLHKRLLFPQTFSDPKAGKSDAPTGGMLGKIKEG